MQSRRGLAKLSDDSKLMGKYRRYLQGAELEQVRQNPFWHIKGEAPKPGNWMSWNRSAKQGIANLMQFRTALLHVVASLPARRRMDGRIAMAALLNTA